MRLTKLDESAGLYDIKGLDHITMHKLLSEEEHNIYCTAINKLAIYESINPIAEELRDIEYEKQNHFKSSVRLYKENEQLQKEKEELEDIKVIPRNLEAEIRKPLEEEIVRLKKENKQLKQRVLELEVLQPKLNFGEEFYYIERDVIRSKKLSDYSIRTLSGNSPSIWYWLRYDEYVEEEDTFKTEEEAKEKLKEIMLST